MAIPTSESNMKIPWQCNSWKSLKYQIFPRKPKKSPQLCPTWSCVCLYLAQIYNCLGLNWRIWTTGILELVLL